MRKRNILLFCINEKLYTNQRLILEMKAKSLNVTSLNPYSGSAASPLIHNSKELSILIRSGGYNYCDDDLELAKTLCDKGQVRPEHIFNPLKSFRQLRDKFKQHLFFQENQIKSLQTWSFDQKKELPEDKLVVKTLRGLGGKGVFLFPSKKETLEFLYEQEKSGDRNYLIQKYVDEKTEIRIFVINNQIIQVIKKIPKDNSFKGNKDFSDAEIYQLLESEKKQVLDIVLKLQALNLTYYALDLLKISQSIHLLEINLLPGIELLEELSSQNIAALIAQQIVNQLEATSQ